jgi:hypothetical protein
MRYSPTFTLRAKTDTAGTFAGWASTFDGPVDCFGSVFAPGAFAAAVAVKRHQELDPLRH